MKSISKAMIAVMIAAAMCVVPLFVAEDSDAYDVTVAGKGASFKASSISNDDFNKLANDTYKENMCKLALGAVVYSEGMDNDYAISVVSISDVKDVKLSLGTDYKEDSSKVVDSMAITFKAKFTATCSVSAIYNMPGTLFPMMDGTQDIYKELGTNEITDGTILTIDGTFTMEKTTISTMDYVKTNAGDFVIKESVEEVSSIQEFDGSVGFNNGVINKTITMTTEYSSSTEAASTFDYYGVNDIKDTVAGTKAISNQEIRSSGTRLYGDYKVGDATGKYKVEFGKEAMEALGIVMAKSIPFPIGSTTGGYEVGTAASLGGLISSNLVAPDYYFCTNLIALQDYTLFYAGYVQDESLKTNDGMKAFLNEIGTASDEFSDASSVANSAYETVSVGGSGSNNIIFYVIIGVLAVAVVALAVLMIKKK